MYHSDFCYHCQAIERLAVLTCRGQLKHQGKSGAIPALSRSGESPNAWLQANSTSTLRVKGLSDKVAAPLLAHFQCSSFAG